MHGNIRKNENGSSSYIPLSAWKHSLILTINFLGFFGCILILYGILVIYTGQTYPLFEKYANPLTKYLTLLGVLLTAASIYGGPNMRLPDPFSKKISAPLVIIAVLGTIGILALTKIKVPSHIINGFALIGIAGGLFRTISR